MLAETQQEFLEWMPAQYLFTDLSASIQKEPRWSDSTETATHELKKDDWMMDG
jgi:hypothetical protein